MTLFCSLKKNHNKKATKVKSSTTSKAFISPLRRENLKHEPLSKHLLLKGITSSQMCSIHLVSTLRVPGLNSWNAIEEMIRATQPVETQQNICGLSSNANDDTVMVLSFNVRPIKATL